MAQSEQQQSMEVDNIVARVLAVVARVNTVLEDREALVKTHLDLNAQTAQHTTGPTMPADAQHNAKPV